MNKNELIQLREIFRARMKERDFCIGEELFRELLGEPEPIVEYPIRTGPPITAKQLADAWEKALSKLNTKMFDTDDFLL